MFFKRFLPSKRKLVQLYFALLFNANIKGFINGSIYNNPSKTSTKNFCVPGLNCYSCPGAIGACPLGSLQDSYSAGKSTIFYVFGILLLFGLMFGRMICSWMCPFGFVQELSSIRPTDERPLMKPFILNLLNKIPFQTIINCGIHISFNQTYEIFIHGSSRVNLVYIQVVVIIRRPMKLVTQIILNSIINYVIIINHLTVVLQATNYIIYNIRKISLYVTYIDNPISKQNPAICIPISMFSFIGFLLIASINNITIFNIKIYI